MESGYVYDIVPADENFILEAENQIPYENKLLVPFNENVAAMAAVSIANMQFQSVHMEGFQDNHQIPRIQMQGSSHRLKIYDRLKQKTNDLQKQINGIQEEVKGMRGQRREIQNLQEELVLLQNQHEQEFEGVCDVLERVSERIDDIEKIILKKTEEEQRQAEVTKARSSGRDSSGPVTSSSIRANCPYCSKDLNKSYLRSHVRLHCKSAYSR